MKSMLPRDISGQVGNSESYALEGDSFEAVSTPKLNISTQLQNNNAQKYTRFKKLSKTTKSQLNLIVNI